MPSAVDDKEVMPPNVADAWALVYIDVGERLAEAGEGSGAEEQEDVVDE